MNTVSGHVSPLKLERNIASLERSSRRCLLPLVPASRAWGGAPAQRWATLKARSAAKPQPPLSCSSRAGNPAGRHAPQLRQRALDESALISHSIPQQASAEHPQTPHSHGRNEACALQGPRVTGWGTGAREHSQRWTSGGRTAVHRGGLLEEAPGAEAARAGSENSVCRPLQPRKAQDLLSPC